MASKNSRTRVLCVLIIRNPRRSMSATLHLKVSTTTPSYPGFDLECDWITTRSVICSQSRFTFSRMALKFSFVSSMSDTWTSYFREISSLWAIFSYSQSVSLKSWRLAVLLDPSSKWWKSGSLTSIKASLAGFSSGNLSYLEKRAFSKSSCSKRDASI